mgnify:CR=1 FL=1
MNIYTETKGFTMLISRNDSCLLIIDVQERLAPAMNDPRKVIDGCARLLKGAALLNVPAIVTEQYPKGLGPTIFDVREAAGESIFFPKTSLSAVQEDGFMQKLEALNKKQIISDYDLAMAENSLAQTKAQLAQAKAQLTTMTSLSSPTRAVPEPPKAKSMPKKGSKAKISCRLPLKWSFLNGCASRAA